MSLAYPNNDVGIIIEFPFHNFAYFPIIKEVMGKTKRSLSANYSRKHVTVI